MAAIKKVGSGRVGSGRTSVTGDGPRASYAGQDGEEKVGAFEDGAMHTCMP